MWYYVLAFMVVSPSSCWASKPINWADGWLVSTMNDQDATMNHVTYSLSARTAVAVRVDRYFDDDSTLAGIQAHRLVKRWNFEDAQANIYVSAGAGAAFADGREKPGVFGGVMADYETRRFFVQYENDLVYAGDVMKSHWHSGRLGWAPYKAAYDKVQPWLMLKADYRSDQPRKKTITPMVRLFTPDWMFEAGVNTRGKPMINLMIQW
jgi:hypothetical protein